MKISIKQFASLAHLSVTAKQEGNLSQSVPSVITYMDQIKNLDIDSVPETSRVTDEINVFREDIVEKSLTQEQALSSAKKSYKGFFVVPYIFEKTEEIE